MSEPQGCMCFACNGPATSLKERAEFGEGSDRVYVCDKPECQPPGTWNTMSADVGALAKRWQDDHPRKEP